MNGNSIFNCLQCVVCQEYKSTNVDMMNHLKQHANPTDDSSLQCIYCLENWADNDKLARHLVLAHPIETKSHAGVECLLCEVKINKNLNLFMEIDFDDWLYF